MDSLLHLLYQDSYIVETESSFLAGGNNILEIWSCLLKDQAWSFYHFIFFDNALIVDLGRDSIR